MTRLEIIEKLLEKGRKAQETGKLFFLCPSLKYFNGDGIITKEQMEDFKQFMNQHKPADTDDFSWWRWNNYNARINFLEFLKTKI